VTPLALDTSVAIPLLVATHRDHAAIVGWWDHREIALSGHALVETYSVLTRLPDRLSVLGIAGGAVYDALVALAAIEHEAELATRDARAKATYDLLGARVTIAG
jgi:predicted nucleic acid-binding protein